MNGSYLFAAFAALVAVASAAAHDRNLTGKEMVEKGSPRLLFAGNASLDLFAAVDESVIKSLDKSKARPKGITMKSIKKVADKILIDTKTPTEPSANAARAYAYCGGKAAYFGVLGKDDLADEFDNYLTYNGVEMKTIRRPDMHTSRLYALATPDGMYNKYYLPGAAETLTVDDLDESIMDKFDFYVVNGFMLGSPATVEFTNKMVDAALSRGKKIITLFANTVCVKKYGDLLKPIAEKSAYLSGNLEEYLRLYNFDTAEELFEYFEDLTSVKKLQHKTVIITMGTNGAVIIFRGRRFEIPATGVTLINTTGAGDFFAGAMLYGLLNGYSIYQAGEFARAIVGDVLSKMSRRIGDGIRHQINHIKNAA
ncbi:Ribokinase like superfamily protein, putative [Babesia bigemina]|uniref:Ribokinase like superfamily protein, putative n=1 Tax=Babesia bigemina TaxID=5866 RepID=A0A061D418_BABBI|nr:Ribokinase like superfamily protein, putative [Babesia bigemina]CDR93724.1 Ribokinase like superfamily protein, putative [Babesia bigemina]|eukprot:XP_012765910.1 Ribokinase like superfamily protein, putative [Babesia bigemina]